jgi:NAD(P)-dependent dehydrogenase (short-subunit alcohol dehydrogenase family)
MKTKRLSGTAAVVTGAFKGIGAAIARQLAAAGAFAVFPASPDSAWITGESLYVTGGLR